MLTARAAAALSISERTLHTRTKAGEVPHVRVGHRVLYPVDVLEAWISAGCPTHNEQQAMQAASGVDRPAGNGGG